MKTQGQSVTRLTLKDRLSRLNFDRACKLLGAGGDKLIHEGGHFEINIDEDVYLGEDLLRVRLNGAVATITEMAEAKQRLRWNCTLCNSACVHVGAAVSLVLEEKVALGLAAPPPERVPVESMRECELVSRAIEERAERARTERMTVRASDPKTIWSDYLVTNALSGKTYRVALRGWSPGDSYCSCPDFRKNTLGTCKHILHVQAKVRRRFSAAVRKRPYRQKKLAVHLAYGKALELRLLAPDRLEKPVERLIRPVRNGPITDVSDLVRRIGRLQAVGVEVIIYPDAEEYLQKRLFQKRIEATVAEIRRDPRKHALRKELLSVPLLPYQLDGIAFAVGAGRAILADDMGLGKTIQGIGVAEMLHREAGIKRVLVVCPASVKSQWRSEAKRFCDRECQLVLGRTAERRRQYDNECFFTICNYEQVLRDILSIEPVPWDLIILDEAQRIKNWEAKTSAVIKALRSPFALALTGTPLENRLDELYSVVEFIDDRRLGPAFRFFNRHRMVDEDGKVLGYKNLGELRQRLAPVLLRRTRASVMRDLPPRTTEIVRMTPTDEQRALHRAHLQIVSSVVRKPYINEMDLLRLRRALLMCRMSADSTFLVNKENPGYSSKLEHLEELLDSLLREEDSKIILFSEWTTMLGLIEPLIERRGADYVRLDGSIPQKKRQQLVNRFQKDPACRLFITTNAGATGLNLQAANTVINVDLPWNPAILEQRIGRAHRMGQKNPVHVYVLVTEGTIEESLLQTLSSKHDLALAALDVESEVDEVKMAGNTEDLKNRLEILLGAQPDAPVDESEKARQAALVQRERVSDAGGRLVGAAFSFIDELLPPRQESEASRRLAQSIQQRLGDCVEKDESGHVKLTLTLPDDAALNQFATSIAHLLDLGGGERLSA